MNWKIIRSVIPLVVLVVFVYYTKSLNPDYNSMEPILITDANDLFWRFQVNEGDEFLYKVVQITGKISDVDSSNVYLDNKIIFSIKNRKNFYPKIGQEIVVKGRCIRYDNILKKINLDHVNKLK